MTIQVSAKSSEQKPRNNFNVKTTTSDELRTFDRSIRSRYALVAVLSVHVYVVQNEKERSNNCSLFISGA